MKIGLQRGNDIVLLASIFLAPITGMILDPKLWTAWTFVMALGAALLMFRMRMPQEKHTQKRLWVAWGLGTGYSLLLCYMLGGGRMSQAALLISFQIWLLPFLGARYPEERALWFMMLGVAYSIILAIILSTYDQPMGASAGALIVLFHVFFSLHLSHSHHQAHRTTGKNQWNRREFRWFAPVFILALAISFPASWIAKTLDWEKTLPSIGNLPKISTSTAPVFLARFETEYPERLYWTYSSSYVMPVENGQWISLWDQHDNISREQMQILETKNTTATHRMGIGSETYTYTIGPQDDDRFPLNGYAKNTRLADGGQRVDAWKSYTDKPLLGFDPMLDALYLSIPSNTGELPTKVDLSGAQQHMPKTWAMVQQWKREGLTDQQFIERTLNYFQNNLAYHFDHQSMKPEENQLDWFLFEDRKGVCRHFANAFALIMRMGGVRSRIRGGFMGGTPNEEGDEWAVAARDAHAWTEVWLDGKGWTLVDPTGVVPVEKGVPKGPEFPWNSSGERAKIHWDTNFQTAGQARENDLSDTTLGKAGAKIQSLVKNVSTTSSFDWVGWVLPAGLLSLLLFGLRGLNKSTPQAREQVEWDKLMNALHTHGAAEILHQGPRSIGQRLAQDWPETQRSAWIDLAIAFEQWKFAGTKHPDLAKRIRAWRKRVKKEFRVPK